jgi:predicted aldo/keto reductase-like oxidoreductase
MEAGRSRRDFIRRAFFGTVIAGMLSRAGSVCAKAESDQVDRRRLGRTGADVSILGLGLGGAFMDAYERNLEAGHALLESSLAKGINYWDTARSYGPSEGMIAPVLARNRDKVFLASKSDARDYEGFKRDLDRSLQVLRTNYIDLYQLHDIRSHELSNLNGIESGAVRAAREAKNQRTIRAFGITGHSGAEVLIECIKRFEPDTVLTIFPATRPDQGRYEQELLPLARARGIGVIAMKTIRYGHQARLPGTELLRYALSLDGIHTTIVGLDSPTRLNQNAAVATGFRPMKTAKRFELSKHASSALAGVAPAWEQPGYIDGERGGRDDGSAPRRIGVSAC